MVQSTRATGILFDQVEQLETVGLASIETPENSGSACRTFVNARLIVTAGSGTGRTLDVKLQISDDNTNWSDLANGAFTQVVAGTTLPFQQFLVHLPLGGCYIRAICTIAGTTPSWDFKVELKFLEG